MLNLFATFSRWKQYLLCLFYNPDDEVYILTLAQSCFARSLLSHLVMGEQEEENPGHLNIINKHVFFHRSRFILYEYEDLCINVNVLLKSLFRKQRCWPCTSISKKSGALHKLMIFVLQILQWPKNYRGQNFMCYVFQQLWSISTESFNTS